MEIEDIKYKLETALQELIENDTHLLIQDLKEQSMTYNLARYLSSHFREFNVDSEYNGNVEAIKGKKFIRLLNEEAKEIDPDLPDDEIVTKTATPDIIVHERGSNERNLLIVEAKKSSNRKRREIDFDITKLKRFTSPEYENEFNYVLGAFVTFVVGDEPGYRIRWFANGSEI